MINLPANMWLIGSMVQVDITALKQMGENDLKELGIPMVWLLFAFFILCVGSICFLITIEVWVFFGSSFSMRQAISLEKVNIPFILRLRCSLSL